MTFKFCLHFHLLIILCHGCITTTRIYFPTYFGKKIGKALQPSNICFEVCHCSRIPCLDMPSLSRSTTSSETSITPAGDGLSIDTERGSFERAAPIFFLRFHSVISIVSTDHLRRKTLCLIITMKDNQLPLEVRQKTFYKKKCQKSIKHASVKITGSQFVIICRS